MMGIWGLLKAYVKDFEIANQCMFSDAAWQRIKQLETDIRTAAQKEYGLDEHQRDRSQRNDAIAGATIRWLGERGYSVAWDGEGYYVSLPRMTKDHMPLMKRHADRVDAYTEALNFAAGFKARPETEAERLERQHDRWMEENAG